MSKPIADYALVGDCHGSALVARDTSVDWCCLRRFDAAPVFCRLLDDEKGGFLRTAPKSEFQSRRAYLPRTNILRTVLETAQGRVQVTDFMPVGRAPNAGVHDYVTLNAPFRFVRLIEGLEGRVRLAAEYRPSLDFAARAARLVKVGAAVTIHGEPGPVLAGDVEFACAGDTARAEFELSAGERRGLVLCAEPARAGHLQEELRRHFAVTKAFWEEWSAYCRYEGPYRDQALRGALTLKALTYAPTGAIVAAPTTSLPESIGGARNWDYRFAWPRDAAFTLYALAGMGYSGEAKAFAGYLSRSCESTHPRVQVLYGIGDGAPLEERELGHLSGYRGSRPVRVGNGARHQEQLDVYGEILDWMHLYQEVGGRVGRKQKKMVRAIAGFIAERWRLPDHGVWEGRGEPKHYVFSKLMCWTALDRALRLLGRDDALAAARDEIAATIAEEGARRGRLFQVFGGEGADAALLLAPQLGIPIEPAVLEATIDAVRRELGSGDYLHRYRDGDGLPGEEGAFLVCSFWLVDALLITGKAEEASALFERLLGRANDVGLYSEEADPASHEFLGNFPQALSHLAMIGAALNLDLHARRGPAGLQGTHADRARRSVAAVAGPRALWAAFRATGKIGRLRSSRESILAR